MGEDLSALDEIDSLISSMSVPPRRSTFAHNGAAPVQIHVHVDDELDGLIDSLEHARVQIATKPPVAMKATFHSGPPAPPQPPPLVVSPPKAPVAPVAPMPPQQSQQYQSHPPANHIETVTVVYATPTAQDTTHCGRCNIKIEGGSTQAMGKVWCPDHFTCQRCQNPIRNGSFYSISNQPMCDSCYLSVNVCAHCHGGIDGEYYQTDSGKLHARCMPKDFCFKCNTEIIGTVVTASNHKWHPRCFACLQCGREISTGSYVEDSHGPTCKQCYESSGGQTRGAGGATTSSSPGSCHRCNGLITVGEYLTVGSHVYHKGCFGCHGCGCHIDPSAFYSVGGAPHCKACAERA